MEITSVWWIALLAYVAAFSVCYYFSSKPWKGIRMELEGTPYYFQSFKNSKTNKLVAVNIGVDAPSGISFAFGREGRIDRFLKFFGLCKETEMYDEEFDRSVFITSDSFLLKDLLLQRPDIRKTIIELLPSARKAVLRSDGRKVWIQVINPPHLPSTEEIKPILMQLAILAKALSGLKDMSYASDRYLVYARIINSINYGFFFAGLGCWAFINQFMLDKLLFSSAWHHGLTLWLGWVLFCLFVMFRSSRARGVVLSTVLTGFIGTTATIYVALFLMNFYLHPTAQSEQVYVVPVTEKYETHGRHGTSYHVKLLGIDPGAPDFTPVHETFFYNHVQVGTPIAVTVRTGGLGYRMDVEEQLTGNAPAN